MMCARSCVHERKLGVARNSSQTLPITVSSSEIGLPSRPVETFLSAHFLGLAVEPVISGRVDTGEGGSSRRMVSMARFKICAAAFSACGTVERRVRRDNQKVSQTQS
jgi:hypothetical protein